MVFGLAPEVLEDRLLPKLLHQVPVLDLTLPDRVGHVVRILQNHATRTGRTGVGLAVSRGFIHALGRTELDSASSPMWKSRSSMPFLALMVPVPEDRSSLVAITVGMMNCGSEFPA